MSQDGILAIYLKDFIEKGMPLGDGYFYLRYTDVIDKKLLDSNYQWHNISGYESEFNQRNLLYTNNGSSVYRWILINTLSKVVTTFFSPRALKDF
jgi:hypothetical protein